MTVTIPVDREGHPDTRPRQTCRRTDLGHFEQELLEYLGNCWATEPMVVVSRFTHLTGLGSVVQPITADVMLSGPYTTCWEVPQ